MKIIVPNYTFTASTKKIVFTDYTSIALNQIYLITNTTTNTIIYNFADSAKGGTVSTNELTLAYNTASMNNTDKLQIIYEDLTKTENVSETRSTFITGRKSSIGTSAVQLTATSTAILGITIKRPLAENGIVYVGASNAVTAGTTDATDGYPLEGGDSLFLPIDNLNKVWFIGSTTGLSIWYNSVQ